MQSNFYLQNNYHKSAVGLSTLIIWQSVDRQRHRSIEQKKNLKLREKKSDKTGKIKSLYRICS